MKTYSDLMTALTAGALRPQVQADGTVLDWEPDDPAPEWAAVTPMVEPITSRQIRLALNQLNLRYAVEAAVASGGRDLRDWWEYSIEFHRDHPMVAAMASAIGATPEQADAVWALGSTL